MEKFVQIPKADYRMLLAEVRRGIAASSEVTRLRIELIAIERRLVEIGRGEDDEGEKTPLPRRKP